MNRLYQDMRQRFRYACLWAKSNSGVFNVFGAIFFVLNVFMAFIWLLGRPVDALAYVLSLISALFFGIPVATRQLYPDRKPPREMSYGELLDFIEHSDPRNDWVLKSTNHASEAFLKEDPRLRITNRSDDYGVQNSQFVERWANSFPDPKAVGYWYDVTYDHALIERVILIGVDGGRCLLPIPNPNTVSVPHLRWVIAAIHNEPNIFQEYTKRAGLSAT